MVREGAVGEYVDNQVRNVSWYDVSPNAYRLDRIRVMIKDGDGKLVDFQYGSVVATIKFKPIRNL